MRRRSIINVARKPGEYGRLIEAANGEGGIDRYEYATSRRRRPHDDYGRRGVLPPAAFPVRIAGPFERGHDPGTSRASGQFVETLFMVTRTAVRAPRHQPEVPREQNVVFPASFAHEPSRPAQL